MSKVLGYSCHVRHPLSIITTYTCHDQTCREKLPTGKNVDLGELNGV